MKKSIISALLVFAFVVVMLAGCTGPNATVTPGESQGTENVVAQELVAYYNSLVAKYDYTKDNKTALDSAYQTGIKNIEANDALCNWFEHDVRTIVMRQNVDNGPMRPCHFPWAHGQCVCGFIP